MAETQVLNSICEYLEYKKHFFWRSNTLPVYSVKNQSFIRMPKYSKTGLPDITIIKYGFYIGLEVKDGKGKQSPNQKQFEVDLKEAGGEYYVVRSIDDCINIGL